MAFEVLLELQDGFFRVVDVGAPEDGFQTRLVEGLGDDRDARLGAYPWLCLGVSTLFRDPAFLYNLLALLLSLSWSTLLAGGHERWVHV